MIKGLNKHFGTRVWDKHVCTHDTGEQLHFMVAFQLYTSDRYNICVWTNLPVHCYLRWTVSIVIVAFMVTVYSFNLQNYIGVSCIYHLLMLKSLQCFLLASCCALCLLLLYVVLMGCYINMTTCMWINSSRITMSWNVIIISNWCMPCKNKFVILAKYLVIQ